MSFFLCFEKETGHETFLMKIRFNSNASENSFSQEKFNIRLGFKIR